MMVSLDGSSNSLVLGSFSRDLGELWSRVAPLCSDADDPGDLIATLHEQMSESPRTHLVPELEALLAGWHHYDSDRRAVLSGAVSFLAEDGADAGRRPAPGDGTEDEKVVQAAVRAVLRRH